MLFSSMLNCLTNYLKIYVVIHLRMEVGQATDIGLQSNLFKAWPDIF